MQSIIAGEETIYDEARILEAIEIANRRIQDLNNANANLFSLMMGMPEDSLEISRIVSANQSLIDDFVHLITELEERLQRLDEICGATQSLFVTAAGLFYDVNVGLGHIRGAWNGSMFLWNVDAPWRSNLQNAWAGRSERISVRIADLEFEREIEELRAVLVANRNHPDFAHMNDEDFREFIEWEIGNFILLREMMPAIEGFEPSAEGGRSPLGDFIFLTDESIFLGVDIEIRQLILERLRETGFVDSTFLEHVMGQPMGELYTGRVNVAFSGSGIYMTLPDIYMTVFRQDIAHTQAMFTTLCAFMGMRLTQRPGMSVPRVRGTGGGPGQWVQRNEHMSQHSRNFQNHVSGGRNNMVYEVRGVRFDGFRNGTLLEAKGNYSQFVNPNTGQFHPWFRGGDALRSQATRQVTAANGTPIQWHFNDAVSMNAVKRYLGNIQGIEFVLNPMP